MKIWLLKKTDEGNNQSPAYDTAEGFVVAAGCSREARQMAGKEAGDEGPTFWMNKYNVIIIMISAVPDHNVKVGILLKSFIGD